MALRTFTVLCNHHHYRFHNFFIIPNRTSDLLNNNSPFPSPFTPR